MSKNILCLASSLSGGGAEKKAINVSNELSINNNVNLFIFKNKIDYIIMNKNFNIINTKANTKVTLFLELMRYIFKNKPDVIISFTRITNIYLGFLKPFINKEIRLIGFEPNLMNEIYSFSVIKRKIFIKSMQVSYRNIDLLINNSDDTKKNIERELIRPKNLTIIHNPVLQNDYKLQEFSDVSHPFFNSKYFPLLMVGRLVPQKSYFKALDIFAKSLVQNPDYRLIILGVGPLMKDLLIHINKLGISNKVDFCGFKTNIFDYMNASKALLLTSQWEGFGNVIVESISVGTPVLSMNCLGGPKEIITSDLFGFLANDEDQFLEILNNRDNLTRSNMEKESMINSMAKFTIKNITSKYKL